MQVELIRLTLNNFKGVSNFTLEPQGKDCVVRGDNATGKTSLFDAFLWLLFNKDSRGRSDFQIKTVDENGEEYTGLDHSVEAALDVDGKEIALKKVYKEQWTKRKGSAHKTLTGHTVDYYIDGVPVKQKEWKQKISELVEEESFKLLTSPFYFNSLHWEKRRNLLLEICGDVADQEVIDSNSSLAQLPEILGNKSIEDYKKVVANRKKEINKRLEAIPIRIDELQNSINNVADLDRSAINTRIKDLEEQIKNAQSGSQVSVLRKQKAELEAELSEKQNQQREEIRNKEKEIKDKKAETENNLQDLQSRYKKDKQELERVQEEVQKCESEMERLRNEYHKKQQEQPDIEESCPTCCQPLPEDQIQAAKDNFNKNKADELKRINQAGKEWKEKKKGLQGQKRACEESLQSLPAKIENTQAEIADLDKQLQDIRNNTTTSADQRISELHAQIQDFDQQIQSLEKEIDTTELQQQLDAERSHLSQLDAAENSKKRIEELKQEEKQLSQEYEKLEQHTYLMEQFVVQKVNLLESKINEKFELARFKLFEQQINEGIKETCITTYKGVPFGQGLNNGASIAVGLDIIKALQEHYGVKAPIWIDNRESLTWIPEMDCQVVSLVVDGNYNQLTIDNQLQEAANE